MTLELIIAAIIAALPTISSIVGIVIAVVKAVKSNDTTSTKLIEAFNETKAEVVKTKEYENLKAQYETVQAQYTTLLKAHRELLTKIDRVVRKEEEYEGITNN